MLAGFSGGRKVSKEEDTSSGAGCGWRCVMGHNEGNNSWSLILIAFGFVRSQRRQTYQAVSL